MNEHDGGNANQGLYDGSCILCHQPFKSNDLVTRAERVYWRGSKSVQITEHMYLAHVGPCPVRTGDTPT